jgi:NAD-dependent deacetylase
LPLIVVLTGAGISAESGLKTFRDSDGLWNDHSIYDVATPEAWMANPRLVLDFYNHRRSELEHVQPNAAHFAIAELAKKFKVQVITQNVDNLHERGGSKEVLHLHGELTLVRGEHTYDSVEEIGYAPVKWGDTNSDGEQLRPHIVWFGEDVPKILDAAEICAQAQTLIVIGTSLNVYPAAGLIDVVPENCQIYLIDPKASEISIPGNKSVTVKKEKAGTAVPALVKRLLM